MQRNFDKTQFPFTTKNSGTYNRRNFSHLTGDINGKKNTTHFILNGDRENVFPLRCGTRQVVHSHHSYLTLCRNPVEVHKISKIPTDWKGKDKTVPIAEGIIVHIENFEESTKQLSE